MAENQVTIEGTQYQLPRPFIVIATQNPVGSQGTFPLPESQLDRFLLQISMDYPDHTNEVDILFNQAESHPVDTLQAVLSTNDLLGCQRAVRKVTVERTVAEYMVQLVAETRNDDHLQLGCSPRGSLLLFRASQANALLSGREYALPDDVQKVAAHVLAHRVVMHRSQRQNHLAAIEVIREIIERVRVPV